MLQKIQTWLKSREEAIKKEQELRKAQSYYRLVKAGNAFIQFVQQDMKKNGDQVNRHMRRRMERELNEKGILSPELVEYYAQKIDYVLRNIHQRLNPPKVQPQNKNGVQVRNTPPPGAKVVELGKQEKVNNEQML
jgi:predicted transcriptional regulator